MLYYFSQNVIIYRTVNVSSEELIYDPRAYSKILEDLLCMPLHNIYMLDFKSTGGNTKIS